VWLKFNRVLCERWFKDNIVLLGDAAHTAHFSIGSGTKLAMEDAAALVKVLNSTDGDVPARWRATRPNAKSRHSSCKVPRAIA
jgi:anthraniloyl-CoA monooxygenase